MPTRASLTLLWPYAAWEAHGAATGAAWEAHGAATGEWRTLTFYDVVPAHCRGRVSNMDVANVAGDMFFSTKDKYLAVACPSCLANKSCHGAATFDCTNPESTGQLVVRQLSVEVLAFGDAYSLCDVWPHHGECEYSCFAPPGHKGPGVGRERVCAGGSWRACGMAPDPSPVVPFRHAWDYWNWNIASRFGNSGGGEWYSLTAADEGLHWRNASVVKAIDQACQARAFDGLVVSRGAACFEACPQPANRSSECWVDCFFETLLGPGAATTLKPPGAQTGAMDVGHLADAWLSGLRHDDPAKGGCPPCPPDSPCPSGGEDGGGGWAGAAPRRAAAGRAAAEFLPPPGVATQTALH